VGVARTLEFPFSIEKPDTLARVTMAEHYPYPNSFVSRMGYRWLTTGLPYLLINILLANLGFPVPGCLAAVLSLNNIILGHYYYYYWTVD
jgi:hypothetical protein